MLLQQNGAGYDAKEEQYPDDLERFDGILISGSLSGVYDKEPWIERLLQVCKHAIPFVIVTVASH